MKIEVTLENLKHAFTLWEARLRDNPDLFMSESERLLDPDQSEWTYGEAAAPYFLSILAEVS